MAWAKKGLPYVLTYVKDWKERTRTKNDLSYTTSSTDGRQRARSNHSRSAEGEATLSWRLSVQKNPKRRRGAFPGVQHMGGVVDKGCG